MFLLSTIYICCGLLVFLLSLPLVYNKVPMNALYGMRIKQSFASDQAWYHLNEIGGMMMAMLSFPLLLSGAIGYFLPEHFLVALGTITLVVLFAAILTWLLLFVRYAHRYQQAEL